VLALVQTRITGWRSRQRFVAAYFGQVDPEDLAERELADLYGAALSHWNFARQRETGRARLRVLNPSIAEHGWQSTHTVVEIVNDDMPFLVDSVTMEVNRHGLTLHLIIHPLVAVRRDPGGALTGVEAEDAPVERRESFIHVEIDRIVDPARLAALAADLERVLADVRLAVGDWKRMQDRVLEVVADIARQPPPIPPDETEEIKAFLRWLAANHFTFLGYRCHDLVTVDGQDALKLVAGSGLGILREGQSQGVAGSFAALPPELRAYARTPDLLIITKANSRSTVHRPGYLDYVGIKRFDARGAVCGEHRFLGLYTSMAYSANLPNIPLLRRKAANVIARAGVARGSHAGKALINILESYPRDELFQTSEDDLLRAAMGILHLGERQRFRLFVRRDAFERFVVCLIYAPRENYTTELRERWQAILLETFRGSGSEFNVHLSESMLARIMITVRTTPGGIAAFDVRELEARLAAAARRWDDDLRDALIAATGEARGSELFRRFAGAFPAGYREECAARAAVADIEMMATLSAAAPLGVRLYRPLEAAPGALRFKLFHLGAPVTLSASLPMLERMGLEVIDERPHRVAPHASPPVWLHDFGMRRAVGGDDEQGEGLGAVFEDAFGRIFRARSRTTSSTGWSLPRGCRPPRSSSCARTPSTCDRPASRCRSRTSNLHSRRTPASRANSSGCSTRASTPTPVRRRMPARRRTCKPSRPRWTALTISRTIACCATSWRLFSRRRGPISGVATRRGAGAASCRSSSTPRRCPGSPSRGRCSRSSCTRRVSRACTCVAARLPAAACAGRIARRISGPRFSASSRRRW
jgi:glutamate dehydrogenase